MQHTTLEIWNLNKFKWNGHYLHNEILILKLFDFLHFQVQVLVEHPLYECFEFYLVHLLTIFVDEHIIEVVIIREHFQFTLNLWTTHLGLEDREIFQNLIIFEKLQKYSLNDDISPKYSYFIFNLFSAS